MPSFNIRDRYESYLTTALILEWSTKLYMESFLFGTRTIGETLSVFALSFSFIIIKFSTSNFLFFLSSVPA